MTLIGIRLLQHTKVAIYLLVITLASAVSAQQHGADGDHANHSDHEDHANHGNHEAHASGYGNSVELTETARQQIDSAKAHILENFGSPQQAEAAGWRRPGSSTPTMGEHWTNPQLTRQPGFDPNQPEILMFAPINGELTLVGASWMNRQSAEADIPPLFDGLDNMWHRHDASDALNRAQAQVAAANGRQGRQRANGIVMNHVWFIDAQQGEFTGHNHWMPFMDADLPIPPAQIDGEILGKAAVALGEVNGSAFIVSTYFDMLSADAQTEVEGHRAAIRSLIPAYRRAHAEGDEVELRALLGNMGSHWEMIRAIHNREFSPEVSNLLNVAYGNMISANEHSADGH